MSNNFSEMKKTMQSRWKQEWSDDVGLIPATHAFHQSMAAVEGLIGKANGLRATGKYSEHGLREEIRTLARRDTVPVVQKAYNDLERVRADLKVRRDKLSVPEPDPTNAAQSNVRLEMRTWLRSQPPHQRMIALTDPKDDVRMLQAIKESPAIMSGLTDEDIAKAEGLYIENKSGPQLARLAELEAALDEANAAVQLSVYQLRQQIEFGPNDDALFNKWMAEATGEAAKAEAAKPTEVLAGEFSEFLDEAFAKAFPALYPDHPANRRPQAAA